jgi:hypothetical protein
MANNLIYHSQFGLLDKGNFSTNSFGIYSPPSTWNRFTRTLTKTMGIFAPCLNIPTGPNYPLNQLHVETGSSTWTLHVPTFMDYELTLERHIGNPKKPLMHFILGSPLEL